MRAQLHDSGRGRAVARALFAAGSALALLGALLFAVGSPSVLAFGGPLEAVGLVVALLSSWVGRFRHGARDVEIALAPGQLHHRLGAPIPELRGLRASIKARDVLGATTAASLDGANVSLALARASRPGEPTVLTLASESDAEAVRRVLGIGHGGRGAVAWRTYVPLDERAWFVFVTLAALVVAAISVEAPVEMDVVAMTIFTLYAAPILIALWAVRSPGKRLLLTPHHLEVLGRSTERTIPYSAIASCHASAADDALVLQAHDGTELRLPVDVGRGPFAAMTADDLEHLCGQVDAAAQRAQGRVKPREDATARLDALRRGDEPTTAWLSRLDALAASLERASSAAYRGASLEIADLWTVLEDPDGDLELRCAAARILSRRANNSPNVQRIGTPEHAVRVATAVAAADAKIERKLRCAVDIDVADDDLAELDDLRAAFPLPAARRFLS